MAIARGDLVVVTKGREKGKRGKVKRVLDGGRVEIEKIMMIKRHLRPTQKDPQGGTVITMRTRPLNSRDEEQAAG